MSIFRFFAFFLISLLTYAQDQRDYLRNFYNARTVKFKGFKIEKQQKD